VVEADARFEVGPDWKAAMAADGSTLRQGHEAFFALTLKIHKF
jgi:hypothetical protein